MATTGSWTVYFLIDPSHDSPKMAPALDFLDSVPRTVAAELMATIDAVAAGPPPSFRGGGRYRVMHGSMTGWHEARTKHGKQLYRLFCLHDRRALGLPGPALVLVTGGVKRNETAFSKTFYRDVRKLGDRYVGSNPREVLR